MGLPVDCGAGAGSPRRYPTGPVGSPPSGAPLGGSSRLAPRRKEQLMPTIIVISNESEEQDSAVLLAENVQPEHLANDHQAGQLLERLMGGHGREGRRGGVCAGPTRSAR